MKLTKWFKLAVSVIILSLFISGRAENVPIVANNPLSAALQASGAETGEISMNGWAKLPFTEIGEEQLALITCQTMDKFGLAPDSYELTRSTTQYQRGARAEAQNDNLHVVVMTEQLGANSNKNPGEVYLVVNIATKFNSETAIQAWQTKINNVIGSFGGAPRISTCLIGWLDGKLGSDDWDSRLQDVFAAAGAQVSDSSRDANYTSYTGYTSAIHDWLMVANSKVNLQAAMRYSPYDDRTYVIVGSPVITIEY